MLARIFRPAKTAMQSGTAQTDRWILDYEPEVPLKVDPLMGYTSSSDMRRQIHLEFDTREEAVAYAERNGIPYRVSETHERSLRLQSYADNFRYDRAQPWTH
ncbi:ETC complex I subunit [Bauldia litoralis]|uniref:ETC complex I subunit conserved region n=1 Tax=Bauldia litoralis TaxID=665467 RepID=A0A1G6B302_9HYPH|nr:ETC complex I subunit [Bauldia litoralis]SDB14922.1 ETC complex I subunit conserved region [Bauldia litoralis]